MCTTTYGEPPLTLLGISLRVRDSRARYRRFVEYQQRPPLVVPLTTAGTAVSTSFNVAPSNKPPPPALPLYRAELDARHTAYRQKHAGNSA
jgi:hypothetical protein